jgi:hypothetical protein
MERDQQNETIEKHSLLQFKILITQSKQRIYPHFFPVRPLSADEKVGAFEDLYVGRSSSSSSASLLTARLGGAADEPPREADEVFVAPR